MFICGTKRLHGKMNARTHACYDIATYNFNLCTCANPPIGAVSPSRSPLCLSPSDSTQLYALNVPASAIRAKVRQEFERNRHVDDLEAADILLLKGYQEFQEVRIGRPTHARTHAHIHVYRVILMNALCLPVVSLSRRPSTAGRWKGELEQSWLATGPIWHY